ncbi:BppU family phage baseplate upper protein [Bacillus safensis]|uniref:BppU family phage baseplate upper protein n=1 Tax=Bacillus safensis TaxID=561879 RepID=UPI002FFEC10B
MTSKTGSLKFDINANTKRTIKASIQFSTQDKGTAQLLFSLTKDGVPLPLSAATVKLALQMADGSKFVRNVELLDKVEGRAAYVLSDEEVTHYGNVSAELYVYYNNNRSMSVHKFGFNIEQALIDQNIVPVAEYYIDDFESLKEIVTELYDDSIELLDTIKAKFEDLDAIETKEGAQAKVDAHAANESMHVTDALKASWNSKETTSGAQQKADAALQAAKDLMANFQQRKITEDTGLPLISLKDTSGSILESIINKGLGQGTFYAIANSRDLPNARSFRGMYHMTDASNGKASFGWVYATDYLNNIYTNYLNNNAWTGWSRISNPAMLSETGQSQPLTTGTDILTLPSGYYYAIGTNVVNMPSATDSSWFNIYVVDNSNNRKTLHVIRSGDNFHWWGTVHNGLFKGWKRMMTDDELSSTWNQVTLVTGVTKHFAGNPLLFSIRQNTLHLRGSFEGIPANDAVIARFAQKPSGVTVFGGTTVGSYGVARLTFAEDGSLKFDGLNANDNTKVTRIEINESIPLW